MAGFGKRFLNKNFKTYKTLLKVDSSNTIYDKIISNFKHQNLKIILILNQEISSNFKNKFKKKNLKIITINKHNKGPVFSIFKALSQINDLVGENEKIFISYSDINWNWDLNEVLKYVKNKDACVFTHSGFHPHLEVNNKSDFCKIKNNKVIKMSQKKTFFKDYKKDNLAIGCYFFKKKNIINKFFNVQNSFHKNKEYYLLSIINYLIKHKINVHHFKLKNFVHLGTPEQYLDFISWKKELQNKNKKYLFHKEYFNNHSTIMLMAGHGRRLRNFKNKKFLLSYKKKNIFKFIFNIYDSKKKIIITTHKLKKLIPNANSYKFFLVNENKSMFKTILDSSKLLLKMNNFFLTSCDCFGEIDLKELQKIIKYKNDLCLFGFDFSNLQIKLKNSHTQLVTKKNNVEDIIVKSRYKQNLMGHAGFFWINNRKVFRYLYDFVNSNYYKTLKREIIIDDYFKYIISKNLINASYIKLKKYVHIGSSEEYKEYNYWEDYFKNDTK